MVVEVSLTERLFLRAICQNDTMIFSERRLLVENAPNFRDLGGHKTQNGKSFNQLYFDFERSNFFSFDKCEAFD